MRWFIQSKRVMKRDHTWIVREGEEKHLEGILSLRKIAFGGEEEDKLDPRFWRWEFKEGPDGRAWIYIVEDKNKIIGHFADIPRRFCIQGEVIIGTLSLDLMVHPDYWRKGIFEAMGRYGAQRVKQGNGCFMTAFPIRPETIFGLKKIGWREVVKLPVLVYPIRFTGILNRYLHLYPLSQLIGGIARFFYSLLYGFKRKHGIGEMEIEKVDLLDHQFDRFWQKASSLYSIMGIRNQNYLTWRYLQHPTRSYTIYRVMKSGEMRGYAVLRKVELLNFNSAVIVDLLALDEEAFWALTEKGIQHGHREGADLLGFMVPQTHPYYKSLIHRGFLPSLKSFQFMIYDHGNRAALRDPKGWYVNWGDTDVI